MAIKLIAKFEVGDEVNYWKYFSSSVGVQTSSSHLVFASHFSNFLFL